MIASWIAYTALVTGLLTIAGMALERMAIARGWPRRYAWIGVLGLTLAWPLFGIVRELLPRQEPVLPFTIVLPTQVITAGESGFDRALFIDRALMVLWIAGSAFFLFRLARGVRDLQRSRDVWRKGEIDGMAVRLSPNVGPAVVGLRSMEVVLPEWIVSLDAPLRALVLRHEEEHRRARDPYFLCAAAVAVALMPWNLALWVQARRLRLAIEMDCDARVLRAHPTPERYGLLMLTIAQRRSIAPAFFAPMLSEPTTDLERRIAAMKTNTRRLTVASVYGGGFVALAVFAFACTLQSENPLGPSRTTASPATPSKAGPAYFEFQVEKPATALPGNSAPRYPDLLRKSGVEGEVTAQFVVDADGSVDMNTFKVLKSDHELFTATVRGALPQMRFAPALVGNKPVKQLIQMPFAFSLTKDEARSTVGRVMVPGNDKPLRIPPSQLRRTDAAPSAAAGRGPTPVSADNVYFEFQVERPVSTRPGNPSPRYPGVLRTANVEGEVLAQFVVEKNGRPDPSSFKVLKSSHELFTASVLAALPTMTFYTAEVGGQSVRQLVQMPFTFSLAK